MGRLTIPHLQKAGIHGGDVLIQTGTGPYTAGLMRVSRIFRECHSIELNPEIHAAAQVSLREAENVWLHLGHSPDVLEDVIDCTRETVFFLDAHAEAHHKVAEPCPVMDELEVIFSAAWKLPPVILIDDARLYEDWFWASRRARGCRRNGWPRMGQLLAVANANRYTLKAVHGMALMRHKNAT